LIIFKGIYYLFLYHQRLYRELLQATAFKEGAKAGTISLKQLRYQLLCSFYTENYYHAKFCLDIINEKGKMGAHEFLLAAFVYARRNDKEKTIKALCDVLEIDPSNRKAKDVLEYIRVKGRDLSIGDDEFFDRLKPSEPFLIPFKKIGIIFIAIILAIGLGIGGYFGFKKIASFIKNRSSRDNSAIYNVNLPDYNPNILEEPQVSGDKYSFTENQIKVMFEQIKRDMVQEKFVEAIISINKLRLSNTSAQVKLKVDMLADMIETPDYALFQNKITFDQFVSEKPIYQGVFVKWQGRVINSNNHPDRIVFDLVMGDEELGVINGIIKVVFLRPVIAVNNENIIVFGRIKTDSNGRDYIEGYNIIRNNP